MTGQLESFLATARPVPFLKWAGGKRQLLSEILPRVPQHFDRYIEPFVGAGALFFSLRPQSAILGDANERLIRTYRALREDVESVIRLLVRYPNQEAFYLKQRKRDIDRETDAEVAAWMLYLNRTGYNGLYRVNRLGRFNVPFGHYRSPRICNPDNLRACSRAVRSAELRAADFEEVALCARRGDFVYFDPPYVPVSRHSSFERYTAGGFSLNDHRRLRNVAAELKSRGARVLISGSDTPAVRDMYSDEFHVVTVTAPRFINCKGGGRGRIPELLITSFVTVSG